MIFPASLSQSKRIGKATQFPVMPMGGAAAFVGALDGVPNLVHLYDIARRWLTAHEGNLVRLRRDSDSAELDFGPDANGDLDTAAITTWLGGATGYIVTIYDQVGGDNVSQATAGNQPLYVASGQGGRPVGRYNGTSHFLSVTYGTALSQPHSLYAAAKLGATGGGLKLFVDSVTGGIMRAGQSTTGASWAMNAGAQLIGGASDTSWHVWSVLFNGASSQFWVNGISQATGNAGTSNGTGIVIGARQDVTVWWSGDIATIAIVDPNHDTADRETVQTALGDYYTI